MQIRGGNEKSSETELFGLGHFEIFKTEFIPLFSRAAKSCGSYTLKMGKVGLRMEVEIFQNQIFSEQISLFSATFF